MKLDMKKIMYIQYLLYQIGYIVKFKNISVVSKLETSNELFM